jgi:1,4-alpha-glucan branching enzyme
LSAFSDPSSCTLKFSPSVLEKKWEATWEVGACVVVEPGMVWTLPSIPKMFGQDIAMCRTVPFFVSKDWSDHIQLKSGDFKIGYMKLYRSSLML